jgi:putative hydrolase of the HAD superfamily
VLFDFGDTLLREGPTDFDAGAAAVLALASGAVGCTAGDLAAALHDLMTDLDPRRQAAQIELPPETIRRLVYEPLGLRFRVPASDLEWAFWAAATSWSPEPGIVDVLADLSRRRIRLAILSNSMFRADTMARQLQVSGVAAAFEFVMTSTEFVLRKPHRRLFQIAAQRLNEEPAKIWFVGDSKVNDIMGAAEAGLVPIWYAPRPVAEPMAPAVRVVRSWSEFAKVLAEATLSSPRA